MYGSEIKGYEQLNYEVTYTTMNAGTINVGSAKNSVSASCIVTIDFRIANKDHMKVIKDKIEELSKKYASFVKDSTRIILGSGPVTAHEVNECIKEESYNKLVEQYKDLIIKNC